MEIRFRNLDWDNTEFLIRYYADKYVLRYVREDGDCSVFLFMKDDILIYVTDEGKLWYSIDGYDWDTFINLKNTFMDDFEILHEIVNEDISTEIDLLVWLMEGRAVKGLDQDEIIESFLIRTRILNSIFELIRYNLPDSLCLRSGSMWSNNIKFEIKSVIRMNDIPKLFEKIEFMKKELEKEIVLRKVEDE